MRHPAASLTEHRRDFYDACMLGFAAMILGQIDTSVFVWSAVLIVVILLLFGVVVWLRRQMSPNEDVHGEGFTLGDLRRLHQSGKLSTEEFEKAKAGIVAAAQAAHKRKEEEQKNLRDFGHQTRRS